MDVKTFEEFSKRRDCVIFFTSFLKVGTVQLEKVHNIYMS